MLFRDRAEAGRAVAAHLGAYAHRPDVIVLALPRGGVPVGYEIARELGVPLDVFVVRKLGVPGQEELAMGAIASGGVRVVNEDVTRALGISAEALDRVAEREAQELQRREELYRGNRPPPDLEGRTVILVDDGLATGSTMRAAAASAKRQNPARIVIAVPVATESTCDELRRQVDEVVCESTPPYFSAVGQWYWDFSQTSDAEVRELIERAKLERAGPQKSAV